jgi:hypothetical protein
MKPSRTELYRQQKAKLEALRKSRADAAPYRVNTDVEDGADNTLLTHAALAAFDAEDAAETAAWQAPVNVSARETAKLAAKLRTRWDEERMDQLLGDCRQSVLRGIAGPFGLGRVVAAADKAGGNVTTAHNARQDIYAREEDAYRREDYAGQAYKDARGEYVPDAQMIIDEYSGELIDYADADCDHIVSAKQYHQNGGFMQKKDRKEAFGADSENFAMTAGSANRSKQHKDFKDWHASDASDGSGRSNKERHGHDNRRVNPAIKRGEAAVARHAPTGLEQAAYYGKRAAATGAEEGAKMGLQQSVGLLLMEFLTASFDEIMDAYKRGIGAGMDKPSFLQGLRTRLGRVAKRVAAKWKDAVAAFKAGAISGFLSNLVTMLVNMLATTGKRMVRVIREGVMSILSALKLALFPPKGMTRAQAGDAALKLLATGLTTSLGILAEDVVEKAVAGFFATHLPVLAPIAAPVSAVLVATMTGIASALLVYWLERLDFFGVRQEREHAMVLEELDRAIADGEKRMGRLAKASQAALDDIDWEAAAA